MKEPGANEELLPIILVSGVCHLIIFLELHGDLGWQNAERVRSQLCQWRCHQVHDSGKLAKTNGWDTQYYSQC
jgi:hypothetical protein